MVTAMPGDPPTIPSPDLETLAAQLERSGDYRVLRRLRPREAYGEPQPGDRLLTGIVLDTETTGTDTTRDEVIELGMIRFGYTGADRVCAVTGRYDGLREPGATIPPEVTRLTGITAAMVAGRSIDPAEVEAFVRGAAVVIAHNARFDRPMVERQWPVFAGLNWACSLDQIAWRAEGFEGGRLGAVLAGYGLFHDGHRAADDCAALLHVLAERLPVSDRPVLAALLDRARRPTIRLWAVNSPFDLKDALKRRGYRWNDGSDGNPRAWWRDLEEGEVEAEMVHLRREVYLHPDITCPLRRITARDRFSVRG